MAKYLPLTKQTKNTNSSQTLPSAHSCPQLLAYLSRPIHIHRVIHNHLLHRFKLEQWVSTCLCWPRQVCCLDPAGLPYLKKPRRSLVLILPGFLAALAWWKCYSLPEILLAGSLHKFLSYISGCLLPGSASAPGYRRQWAPRGTVLSASQPFLLWSLFLPIRSTLTWIFPFCSIPKDLDLVCTSIHSHLDHRNSF